MMKPAAFLWVDHAGARLTRAQEALEKTLLRYGLDPVRVPCGRRLVPIGDVLLEARRRCSGHAFLWCNSDVVLTRDPFDVPAAGNVYGFLRREVPSGEITLGVDMLYIPVKVWDEVLSKDIPQLLLGASFVDWWIPRCMGQRGTYADLTGYIDHVTHERSPAATSDANPGYQHNFREYNRWAKRNGLDPIPAPPFLIPRIGHVWGIRDAVRKIFRRACL